MKKLLAFFLIAALLTLPVMAHMDGGTLGDVPFTDEEIIVDGIKDEIYDYGALEVQIDQALNGSEVKATAVAYLLYKDGYLYVFASIKDKDVVIPTADQQQSQPWVCDSLEVFINEPNGDDNAATMQYRIDNENWPCAYNQGGLAAYGADAAAEYFKWGEVDTAAGYDVEYAIPVAATTFGVNFQINDVSSDGSAQTWAMAYSEVTKAGAGSWVAAEYPYLTVGGSTVNYPIEEDEEEAAAEGAAAAEAPKAAKTVDVASIALIVMAITGTGIVVSKKH